MDAHDRTLTLASRLAGGVWGHLVGDAMGVPYEFLDAARIGEVRWGRQGGWGVPTGTWSDDGSLMLALLDSLLEAGFDPEDQGRRALAWADEGAYTPDQEGRFDIGGTTSAAMAALRAGTPAIDAGPTDDHASGNGSLMRILPLALMGRDLPDTLLVERAHLASRVTHGHPRAQVACAAYVLVAVRLLRWDGAAPAPEPALQAMLADALAVLRAQYAAEPALAGHLAALEELEAWTGRSGRGYVIDSFWSAWDALAGASSVEQTIARAIAYGHDTDTTAAIAGGLAGIRFGWEGIPVAWRRGIRDRAQVTRLVDGLVGTLDPTPRTSTASPLRVDALDLDGLDLAGRAGITFLPGKKYPGWVTGRHWRDLDLDAARLHDLGIDEVVLLVQDKELRRCRVEDVAEGLGAAGVELRRFAIPDPHLPEDDAAYCELIGELVAEVRAGRSVAFACRGGLDRAGMTAACFLVEAGLDPETAIDRVHRARSHTLTEPPQLAYVRAWRTAG
jgi:ADP-ribosylglycohydrolase